MTIAVQSDRPASPVQDSDPVYEIIDGQRVELPPMSAYATLIACRLVDFLNAFARQHTLGQAVTEMLFHLTLPVDRNRRPDAAFVSFQRWAKGRPFPRGDNAWDVVPDLAVEVISPNDLAEDLVEKLDEYFRAGVRLAWVVYPAQRLVYVYESMTNIRGLTGTDQLDGGAVLPGFRLALTELFQEPTEPA